MKRKKRAGTNRVVGACLFAMMAVASVGAVAQTAAFDQAAFDLLPASFKQSKQIKNVVNAPIVPWVNVDPSGKLSGPVVDLTDAVAKVLGITFVTSVSSQANTILDIKGKRVDLSFGTMSDTPALEKEGSFLVYLLNPRAFLVKKGNTRKFVDLSSVCGMSIALQGTSSSQPIIKAASKQYCESKGSPPIVIKDFPSVAATALAVQSGQADSILLTLPQVIDIAKQAPNQFEVVLEKLPNGLPPIAGGIFFPADTELLPAVKKAFDKLIASGVYEAILKKYGLEGSGVKEVVVNMATTRPKMLQADPPLTELK
jgi:polar amino acid transport system substrate-binding protein